MYFIFFKYRHRDGSESGWQAGRTPYANKAAADAQRALMLEYVATASTPGYAAAVVRHVRLPS